MDHAGVVKFFVPQGNMERIVNVRWDTPCDSQVEGRLSCRSH